jgi:hypothetical protein
MQSEFIFRRYIHPTYFVPGIRTRQLNIDQYVGYEDLVEAFRVEQTSKLSDSDSAQTIKKFGLAEAGKPSSLE